MLSDLIGLGVGVVVVVAQEKLSIKGDLEGTAVRKVGRRRYAAVLDETKVLSFLKVLDWSLIQVYPLR